MNALKFDFFIDFFFFFIQDKKICIFESIIAKVMVLFVFKFQVGWEVACKFLFLLLFCLFLTWNFKFIFPSENCKGFGPYDYSVLLFCESLMGTQMKIPFLYKMIQAVVV